MSVAAPPSMVPVRLKANVGFESRDYGPDYGSPVAVFPPDFAKQLMRDGRGVPAYLGPCTRETQRCDSAKDMRIDTAPCCQHGAMETLRIVQRLFDTYRVTWWADYGTLLGAVRHGGLIPWDKDCDVGVLDADQTTLFRMRELFEAEGFKYTYLAAGSGTFGAGDRVKIRWSPINEVNTDVFFWLEQPDGNYHRRAYTKSDRFKGREFPTDWLFPLRRVPFGDITVPVPAEAEKLLTHRYGDWQAPLRANNDGVPR